MPPPVKVSFVVPRYGPTIIGGAETAARELAEHLVRLKGWEVEVLTSRAEDFVTWAETLPAGVEDVNGVRVVRFASAAGRHPSFHPFSASLLADPARASLTDAERWIDLQGPVVPELVEAALHSDADALIFYPYLYYPTVRLIDRVRTPTILHPRPTTNLRSGCRSFPRCSTRPTGWCSRRRPSGSWYRPGFRWPAIGNSCSASGWMCRGWRRAAGAKTGSHPDGTGATGVEPRPTPAGDPYLLCLGRVDRHKGTTLLAELFSAYKQRHPGPLRLVLAGPVVEAPADHPDIDVVGPVPEAQKWALLEGALALVSPSPWEAFSLVIAESWSAGAPVVVNAGCAATVEHCRRSGGGLSFAGFGEFEAVVDRLATDERLRVRLGGRGRAYVDRWFRWPRVIDRYAAFVESVVAAA